MTEVAHFIDGARVAGRSGRTQPVRNPATGTSEGEVALASAQGARAAVAAASAVFPAWRATPPLRWARVLDRFGAILWERADRLAEAISAEHGKTHDDALGEVTRGLEVVKFAAGAPHLLKGEFSENVGTGVDSHSIRQPLGVVVGITPFNFPVMVPMWMFPIALAAGNTFVLKPSERDPSPSLLLAEWLGEAGLPAGVLNVVQGGREGVDALLAHPEVKAVSFVGSTPVASYVHRTAMAKGKRCQALGGAKNHMVIMRDADMDMAAGALMGAAFGSAGERCMAISVVVPVGERTAEAPIKRLVPRIEAPEVGPASDHASEMGPLVTAEHLNRVRGHIAAGEAEGATVVVDGRAFRAPQGYEGGYFIGGTLLDHVTPDMSIRLNPYPSYPTVRTANPQPFASASGTDALSSRSTRLDRRLRITTRSAPCARAASQIAVAARRSGSGGLRPSRPPAPRSTWPDPGRRGRQFRCSGASAPTRLRSAHTHRSLRCGQHLRQSRGSSDPPRSCSPSGQRVRPPGMPRQSRRPSTGRG